MTDNSEIKTLLLAPDDYNPSFLARWWNVWGEAEKGAVNRLRVIDKTIVDL